MIGRSSDCDLTVPGRKSSRQHAEVRFEGDQVVIEDLGSTNGTFLNGEVLGEKRVLRPGDRIHIGGTTITFCHVDSQLTKAVTEPDDDAAATVIFDGPPIADTGEALRGDLSEIPASAVLQVLEVGGKTGALGIVTDEGTNRIWLENGRPVHAESPSQEGTEAALLICRITEGRFVFDPGHPAPEASIKMSLTELLLESSRRYDESYSK